MSTLNDAIQEEANRQEINLSKVLGNVYQNSITDHKVNVITGEPRNDPSAAGGIFFIIVLFIVIVMVLKK